LLQKVRGFILDLDVTTVTTAVV